MRTIDASRLPDHAFGHRALTWWGTAGFMAIEGTALVLAAANLLYLRGLAPIWPPSTQPPSLLWGSLNTAVLTLSAIPNHLTKTAAEREDLPAVKRWLSICLLFGLAFCAIRAIEFRTLHVAWYTDTYGSIVWILLGMHTFHVVTDVLDSAVLRVMLSYAPFEKTMFANTSENSLYWYFVLAIWVPVYGLVYLLPLAH
jgi:heme/copper-type cytochrome/quinol oxidase subunit 3